MQPQSDIHQRRTQQVNMPRKEHQPHFRRYLVHPRMVVLHGLPSQQKRNDSKHSDNEVNPPQGNPLASEYGILTVPVFQRRNVLLPAKIPFRQLRTEY